MSPAIPAGVDDNAKEGSLCDPHRPRLGEVPRFTTGQCPVMHYHRGLMNAILNDRVEIAKAVNATVITLDEAPQGYKDFDSGVARKFGSNPNELIKAA